MFLSDKKYVYLQSLQDDKDFLIEALISKILLLLLFSLFDKESCFNKSEKRAFACQSDNKSLKFEMVTHQNILKINLRLF